jgi:hypothetical protein
MWLAAKPTFESPLTRRMESKLTSIGSTSETMDAEETRDGALIEMEFNAGTNKDKRSVCRQRCCGGNSSVCQHTGYQRKAEIF